MPLSLKDYRKIQQNNLDTNIPDITDFLERLGKARTFYLFRKDVFIKFELEEFELECPIFKESFVKKNVLEIRVKDALKRTFNTKARDVVVSSANSNDMGANVEIRMNEEQIIEDIKKVKLGRRNSSIQFEDTIEYQTMDVEVKRKKMKRISYYTGKYTTILSNNPKLQIIFDFIKYCQLYKEKGIIVFTQYKFLEFVFTEIMSYSKVYSNKYSYLKNMVIKLHSYVKIDNKMTIKGRKGAMISFKTSKGAKVLLSMVGLIDAGFNFPEANNMLITSIIEKGTSNIQVPPRIIRLNQKKPCAIIKLLMDYSFEVHHESRHTLEKMANHQMLMNNYHCDLEDIRGKILGTSDTIDFVVQSRLYNFICQSAKDHIVRSLDVSAIYLGPEPTDSQLI